MPNFESVLDKRVTDVEKPKPKPTGTYGAIITGTPEFRTMPNKQGGEDHKIVSFKIKAQYAGPDVDPDQLADVGSEVPSWPAFTHDIFYGTPEGEWALVQFLTNTLGIDPGEGKAAKSVREILAEAPGKQLTIELKHEPYVNRSGEADIATRIKSTAKI